MLQDLKGSRAVGLGREFKVSGFRVLGFGVLGLEV